jgi:hypothetical protein
MKLVITDYSSYNQTEPSYFNTSLNLIDGCSSTLWNTSQISAYDIFDMVKPNIWITHIKSIVTDGLAYMSKEDPNIQLIINITSANQEEVYNVENFILDKKINCAFFFTNLDDSAIKSKKIKILNIQLGADIFLGDGKLNYYIDKGIFVNNKSEMKSYNGSFHYIANNQSLEKDVDVTLSIQQLSSIYKNYGEIVFRYFDRIVPQLFYDAVYRGNKVYYDIDNTEKVEYVNSKFKKLLKIDTDLCSDGLDFNSIKECVKSKHTCLNRVKSLLSQLPCNDMIEKLETIIRNNK